jgi:molybdenum cofactor cytidylyltransferase
VGSIVLAAELRDGDAWAAHAVRAALEAGLWPVVAVVGERAEEVRAALAGLPVATVAAGHARGPGGAIRLGLGRVSECAPAARGVVLVGGGPPAVDARQLRALPAAARPPAGAVVASRRGGVVGLPAFFPAAAFVELSTLDDGEGCAELLVRHAAELVALEWGGGRSGA